MRHRHRHYRYHLRLRSQPVRPSLDWRVLLQDARGAPRRFQKLDVCPASEPRCTKGDVRHGHVELSTSLLIQIVQSDGSRVVATLLRSITAFSTGKRSLMQCMRLSSLSILSWRRSISTAIATIIVIIINTTIIILVISITTIFIVVITKQRDSASNRNKLHLNSERLFEEPLPWISADFSLRLLSAKHGSDSCPKIQTHATIPTPEALQTLAALATITNRYRKRNRAINTV